MAAITYIKDLSAPELDCYARLSENQLVNRENPSDGLFIAESPLVIGRALDNGYEPVSMLVETRQISGEAADVINRCGGIPVFSAEESVLTGLTGFKLTRGALCAMRRKPLKSAEDICADARRIAVLEDVVNPTNLGAIFRSAAALGIDAVLLTPACTDPLYRRAVRVSMGNVFSIPWTYLAPPAGVHYADHLRDLGFATAAMALRPDSVSIRDAGIKSEKKLAVILGSEGPGLKAETMEKADYRVIIPMKQGVDSLNVAAAAALAFWEFGRTDY